MVHFALFSAPSMYKRCTRQLQTLTMIFPNQNDETKSHLHQFDCLTTKIHSTSFLVHVSITCVLYKVIEPPSTLPCILVREGENKLIWVILGIEDPILTFADKQICSCHVLKLNSTQTELLTELRFQRLQLLEACT